MAIYALSDLHLCSDGSKPMNVFGSGWDNHTERIYKHWQETVTDDDIILIPGDISWAMTIDEARSDLEPLFELPGNKVFLKGNHDYWWNSLTRVTALAKGYDNVHFIQNNACVIENTCFCGTRGWLCPGSSEFKTADMKYYQREINRLKLSLNVMLRAESERNVVLMHFPPILSDGAPTGFTELIESCPKIDCVVYGHLHGGVSHSSAFTGVKNGIRYELCSADYLGFVPKLILE